MTNYRSPAIGGAIPRRRAVETRAAPAGLPMAPYIFLVLAIAAVFSIGGDMLHAFGINYVNAGGNLLHKIHPGSYLAVACLVTLLIGQTSFQRVRVLSTEHPAIVAYLAGSAVLLAYVTTVLGLPAATIVDSWICAGLLAAALSFTDGSQRRTLLIVIHLLMAANSLVGFYEFVTHSTLFPIILADYSQGGMQIDLAGWAFERSRGLFGHPLLSSLAAGMMAVSMFAQIAFHRATMWRVLAMAHSLAALPTFAGRTSIAFTALAFALIILVRLFMFMQGRGARPGAWAGIVIVATLAPIAMFIANEMGAFDTLMRRVVDDSGSAQTRLVALEILKQTPPVELMFGDLNNQLIARQVRLNSAWGIEIGWVALTLHFGLIATAIMVVLQFGMLRDMAKKVHGSVWWTIGFFYLASSSGTGLASKTVEFSILICMVAVLFPRQIEPARPAPSAPRRAAPGVHGR